jgi:outer membrane protein OmpA-like peptidoglycan-associated protein
MHKKCLVLGLVLVLSTAACSTMNRTEKGAVIGTGVGAATGAALGQAIGGNTGATLLGAGAGALAGGLAGGLIGNYMDRQERDLRQAFASTEAASIQRDQDVLALTFKSDMLFDVNSATLKPGAYQEIDRAAAVLKRYPQTRIRVAGHTDSTGSETYNMELSRRRAEAVRNALVTRGVDPARIDTVGYGESSPIAGNDTPSGRQMNRRVTLTITPIRA